MSRDFKGGAWIAAGVAVGVGRRLVEQHGGTVMLDVDATETNA